MTLVLDPTTLPPAIKGWLGAHVAFRRDADALVAAVNAVEPSDNIGAGRLADAFAVTVAMLHEHHETEDELIFPELIKRSPAFAGVVMTLSLEHVDVDDVVDDINRDLAMLTGKSSRAIEVHARLTRQVETFRTLVDLHIEVEEEHALPLFLRCFTTDEIDAIGDEHFAKNADKLTVMIPWSASAMTPDVVVEMLADLPVAVQENFSRWSLAFQQAFAPMLVQPRTRWLRRGDRRTRLQGSSEFVLDAQTRKTELWQERPEPTQRTTSGGAGIGIRVQGRRSAHTARGAVRSDVSTATRTWPRSCHFFQRPSKQQASE